MADEEHIRILRQGVDAWNQWRQEMSELEAERESNLSLEEMIDRINAAYDAQFDPPEEPFPSDLGGADLSEAILDKIDLRGADLSRVDLSEARLSEADLSGTNLNGASLWRAVGFKVNLTAASLFSADLRNAFLREALLREADLASAKLGGAALDWADLSEANLRGADLSGADLGGARLIEADLTGANLSHADLSRANLDQADLSHATCTGADLTASNCIQTRFTGAILSGCKIYGISAWDVELEGTMQADLRITPPSEESAVTVDNLEVAQFLYLLLHNQKARALLDTITSKVVLILGRFADRKPILDALREVLRRHPNGYIPVLFDFDPQQDKPVLETVKTLANLARFVIADLTDPHMVRAELTAIIPNVPTVPVQPIIEADAELPTEYASWRQYRSFLPVYRYDNLAQLLSSLTESVIEPVEKQVQARRLADTDTR